MQFDWRVADRDPRRATPMAQGRRATPLRRTWCTSPYGRAGLFGRSRLHSTIRLEYSTMLVDGPMGRRCSVTRPHRRLFRLDAVLGGSISGEQGVGWVKSGNLDRQWAPTAVSLNDRIKQTFGLKNLLNPGKKT